LLNQTASGPTISKTGTRNNRDFGAKKSFYSEWADGGDLYHFLNSEAGRNLTPEQKNILAKQLLLALQAMHKDNEVHQDIKLANILISSEGEGNFRLQLADFGLTSNRRNFVGTREYLAPEIAARYKFKNTLGYNIAKGNNIAADAKPNKANDMWAVGILLYELYNQGRTPTTEKQVSDLPDDPINDLIKQLLIKERTKRITVEHALTNPLMAKTTIPPSIMPKGIIDIPVDLTIQKQSALILAVDGGHADTAKFLIAAGANIHTTTMEGETLLQLALKNNSIECVQVLIATGDVKILKEVKETLLLAIKNSDYEKVKGLILAGATTTLLSIVQSGDIKNLKALMAAGIEIPSLTKDVMLKMDSEKQKEIFHLLTLAKNTAAFTKNWNVDNLSKNYWQTKGNALSTLSSYTIFKEKNEKTLPQNRQLQFSVLEKHLGNLKTIKDPDKLRNEIISTCATISTLRKDLESQSKHFGSRAKNMLSSLEKALRLIDPSLEKDIAVAIKNIPPMERASKKGNRSTNP
jgi:serine/threonine protein kinase